MADSFKKRRIMSDFTSQDILMEILKRLPIKYLLRCMCVEKSWYRLIQSPYFIDLHFHHKENKDKYLFFQDRNHSKFFLRVDDKQCNKHQPGLRLPRGPKDRERGLYTNKIHGICRGLICFSVENLNSSEQHRIYLWNPAIRIFEILPKSPDPPRRHKNYTDFFAFGYFQKINDYKVIKFQCYYLILGKDPPAPTVYIYSLSTNSWKTVGKDNVAQFSNYRELYNSVIVNGVAYWVGIKDPFMQVIVCFDIENEKIQEIMLPPEYALDRYNGHISSFNLVQRSDEVLLSAAYMNYGAKTSCILDIFALENDGVDVVCTKKVSIDLNKVGRNWWPIGFRYNGEIILFNYHYTQGGFLSYDHEKEVATEILDNSWDLWYYADIYTPDNPAYYYNSGMFDPFDAGEEHMQFMYVNSFEESLVLLGNEL
ncbi:F-box domain-containing protein [Heracleum sosnowskyi]|uniref:F-box domain-containing protein n=1 Tax=Heracleum sosnowskyi TaxID=360622 RepID=A0AAD8I3E2_9APIA|nr:F-box domain-containing protein [Heracleum sosnowskyi]